MKIQGGSRLLQNGANNFSEVGTFPISVVENETTDHYPGQKTPSDLQIFVYKKKLCHLDPDVRMRVRIRNTASG